MTAGSVDRLGLRRHVEMALRAGVQGFLVPAMASEVDKLTIDERLALVETVLDVARDETPVFAGAGESDPDRQKALSKSYLELGCNLVLFQIPFEEESQFKRQFFRLAELQPEIIMLQDWDPYGYGLPDSLILELFEQVEAFRCLKIETVPAGVKYSRILELTGGRLHISGGWAVNQMIEGLSRGVHAFMPTGMHFIYTQIYSDYVSGRREEAKKLFEQILPVLSFSNQHLDISIHFFKRLAAVRAVSSLGAIAATESILDLALDDPSSEVRVAALEALRDLEYEGMDAVIAPGYGTVSLTLDDGSVLRGALLEETETQVVLKSDGQRREISKREVATYEFGTSSMPAMGSVLTRSEIRDMVEYLSSLNGN